MTRVVVTGAGGQLGSELTDELRGRGHQVTALTRVDADISVRGVAESVLRTSAAEVVVNCAAWTRVDAAETEQDAAYRANAIAPRLLADACRRAGTALVHVSTDFVFDGEADRPIDEWAPTGPRSVYGASKLAGEDEVRRLCPDHAIVRTAWVFGRSGPNFVLTMLRLARERRELRVVTDQQGSPTWTGHLAPALALLMERGHRGTFHLTGSGVATWHRLATVALAAAGLDEVLVSPISTADYPTPAQRPRYSVLDNRAWRLLGEQPLPTWEHGVAAYVRGLAQRT